MSSCCSVLTRIDWNTNVPAAALHGFAGPVATGLGGVWLAAEKEGMLWRIEPSDRARANTFTSSIGPNPTSVAVGVGSVWVTNGDGTVSRVDPSSYESTTIRIGKNLSGIAVGEGAVWVTVN